MKDNQSQSRVQNRLLETQFDILREPPSKGEVIFLNTVLCQTSLPLSSRKLDGATEWERTNGRAILKIKAGEIADPKSGKIIKTQIPYGKFARLFFYHLCTRIVKENSRDIELSDSFQQFARSLGIHTTGRELNSLRMQVYNILGSEFIIHNFIETEQARIAETSFMRIADDIKLWLPKGLNQIEMNFNDANLHISERFYNATREHAIPFDPRAIGALSHNCMAMDILGWLTQLLPRLDHFDWKSISWGFLYNMYGHSYDRLRDFRKYFLQALDQALIVYPAAKNSICLSQDTDEYGNQRLMLKYAPPMIEHTKVYIPQAITAANKRAKEQAAQQAEELKARQKSAKAIAEAKELSRKKREAIQKLNNEKSEN